MGRLKFNKKKKTFSLEFSIADIKTDSQTGMSDNMGFEIIRKRKSKKRNKK